MLPDHQPDPEELIVRTRYFVSAEINKSNLQTIQRKITRILQLEGYRQSDIDPLPFSPVQQTMDFRLFEGIPIEKSMSLIERTVDLFKSNDTRRRKDQHTTADEFLEGLMKARDDLPFRLIFHFKPYEEDDIEGYDIEVESEPVLLQKYRHLPIPEDYSYNTKDIISQNKREIKRMMGRLGLEPLQEPYTEAETLETVLNHEYRKHLSSLEYGANIIRYLDEGDACFQRDLRHASLNCYIHAIEWAIITYLNQEKEKDVIKEQKQNEKTRYYFHHLVDMVGDSPSVEQKTMESLKQYKNTERHWIAHHRSGDIPESRVKDVRETLLNLIGELFRLGEE